MFIGMGLIKGFVESIVPMEKPIDEHCMKCPHMPEFARKGMMCVKYVPVSIPILDIEGLMELMD